MKGILIIMIMLVIPLLGKAQIKEVKLQASGLTCSMCSNSIHKALEKLSFVEKVKSDVETSVFTITFKEKSKVDILALQKAVKKAGFSVSDLVIAINFNKYPAKNNGKFKIADEQFYLIGAKEKILDGIVEVRLLHQDFMSKKAFKKVKSKIKTDQEENAFTVTLA